MSGEHSPCVGTHDKVFDVTLTHECTGNRTRIGPANGPVVVMAVDLPILMDHVRVNLIRSELHRVTASGYFEVDRSVDIAVVYSLNIHEYAASNVDEVGNHALTLASWRCQEGVTLRDE